MLGFCSYLVEDPNQFLVYVYERFDIANGGL